MVGVERERRKEERELEAQACDRAIVDVVVDVVIVD